MKKYDIQVGDSDKYYVNYAGSLEEFLHSADYKGIKDKLFGLLKEEFPEGGYEDVVKVHVEECTTENCCEPLDESGFAALAKSAKRQIEVKDRTNEQNLNAPFDQD